MIISKFGEDEKDAVLIARLTAQLRCYVPEPVDETWGRLRHLGARRTQLLAEAGSQVQQMRALLECAWPASLDTARQPFRWATWPAAMSVILDRDGGDLARTRRLGLARFEAAVRREVIRRGRQKPCIRIVRQLFAALTDPAGVIAHRAGALERVSFLMDDWCQTHRRLAGTETRMTRILEDLQLTELVTSITGISAVGAAAILAETGDPNRFATGRALIKHAGLAPREKLSGTFVGHSTKLTGQGPTFRRLQARRLAGGLGSAARQPRLRGPIHPLDQPRAQQAHCHPGPGRDRCSDLASAACRYHHRSALGPRHRHPRRKTLHGAASRRLTPGGPSSRVGASPTRH